MFCSSVVLGREHSQVAQRDLARDARGRTRVRFGVGRLLGGAKMKHLSSIEDQDFRREFETCRFSPAEFNHRAHIRLAYVYLSVYDTDTAHQFMRSALLTFLEHHGVDLSKYHETMTKAWIEAVRHFMENTPSGESSDLFIEKNPRMLDPKIMMTHYSAEVLFSDEARAKYVEPNLDPIPKYRR